LGSLNYAEKLFDTVDIPRNSLIMYTTMIKAYANFGNPKEAFVFYSRMLCDQNHVYPNDFTFTYTCLLKKHLKIIKPELTRNPKQPVVV
jgi:pentatricopeptide repeat protein